MENEKRWKVYIRKVLVPLSIFTFSFIPLVYTFNLLLNLFKLYEKHYMIEGTFLNPSPIEYSWSLLFDLSLIKSNSFYFLLAVLMSMLLSAYFTHKIISNYGKLNKGDEKGSSRFTTLNELKNQYRAVPDKLERFEGSGGIPISRYKNQLFIDDSPVNNLWIGTTRSGKGEIGIISAIDVYSRAEKQASMIIADPKGELFAASKEPLEKLGYHVACLNLMNPFQSISYNIIELVKQEFLSGNFSQAQQYARSVAFMLYNDPSAKDKYFQKASTDLCTALILGLCEYCKDTPEKITMYNVALMMIELATQTEIDEDGGIERTALDIFFEQFPASHPARMQYATINFAKSGTRASVLSNTAAELAIFTLDGTAKLTSMNSLDMRKFGFNHWVTGKTKPLTRVNVYFGDSKETIKSGHDGLFTIYHKNHAEIGDIVRLEVNDERTSIKIVAIDEKSGEVTFEYVDGYGSIEVFEYIQFEKPIALFMIIPDYDQTFNVIASLYVKQVYSINARVASNVRGNKCFRELVFLLDEFGNLPAIEGIPTMLTVCLGRNMRFNLFVQAYSQIEELYGSAWKTIDGNCNNTIYLLTSDYDTAKRISDNLGNKQIKVKSRSGKTLDLDKNKTESIESRPLLDPNEVMRLKEAETLVIRTIKRQDKNGNRIRQYPIYNTGKTTMKYRWEYLSEIFNTANSVNDIDIDCEHADLDLSRIRIVFEVIPEDYEVEIGDIEFEEPSFEQSYIPFSNNVIEIKNNDTQKQKEDNGLNEYFFKSALKNESDFSVIFMDKFSSLPIGKVKDLVIAYKDYFKEQNFLVILNMLQNQLEKDEVNV